MTDIVINPHCCGDDCVLASDDFDRADNDDLGPRWEEIIEDWEIKFDRLQTFDDEALAIFQCLPPPDNYVVRVRIPFVTPTSGHKPRVIVDYLDSNNFHYAELDTTVSPPHLALYKRAAGSDTKLAGEDTVGLTADEDLLAMIVCFTPETFSAQVTPSTTSRVSAGSITPHEGLYTGVGNGIAVIPSSSSSGASGLPIDYEPGPGAPMAFDDFEIVKHSSPSAPHCPNCV